MGENVETAATPAPATADGRLREYETMYLLKPDLGDDVVDKLNERMRGIVAREGGRVIKFTNHGKRKTAYEVKKNPRAIMILMSYLGRPGLVTEVERNLRLTEDVMKLQSVKLAELVDPASRPTEQDVKLTGDIDETARPPRDERADEIPGDLEGGDLAAVEE